MGETNIMSEVRKLKKTTILISIVVVALYLVSAILGIGNSFTRNDIVKIRQIVLHEEVYGTILDEDWKNISELNVEKTTQEDGTIVFSHFFKGELVFENVAKDGEYNKDVGYPIEYEPNISERLILDLVYLIAFAIIAFLISTICTWAKLVFNKLDEYFYEKDFIKDLECEEYEEVEEEAETFEKESLTSLEKEENLKENETTSEVKKIEEVPFEEVPKER